MSMEIQEIINNKIKSDRADRLNESEQLTLGELILKIEPLIAKQEEVKKKYDHEATVFFDFCDTFPTHLHSWRGSYNELAIGWNGGQYGNDNKPMEVSKFLEMLKEAIGKTYQGWKGGDFKMGKNTPIWISDDGMGSNNGIIDIRDDEYRIILITSEFEY